jgi:hypothetical protein
MIVYLLRLVHLSDQLHLVTLVDQEVPWIERIESLHINNSQIKLTNITSRPWMPCSPCGPISPCKPCGPIESNIVTDTYLD